MPWYVYKDKNIIAKTYYKPCDKDLSSREEKSIFLQKDVEELDDWLIEDGKLKENTERKEYKRKRMEKVRKEKEKREMIFNKIIKMLELDVDT